MTHDQWRQRHAEVHAAIRAPKRIPTCHPQREHKARGMCDPCYQRWRVAQLRMEQVTP